MHVLKPIPDADKLVLKEKFVEHYSRLTDFETFKKYSLSFLRKSIRVNTLKASVESIKKRMGKQWGLEQIPWCDEGFWIHHEEGRRDIGNTLEHQLGYIYVQEAASMIPPIVLNPLPGETVLDIAAAPGSKTSQMAAMMQNTGVLVANDITGDRLASLGVNLLRCGVANAVVRLGLGEKIPGSFDKILVDAPCSGTGAIRKSLGTLQSWNPNMILRLAGLQKKLLAHAFSILKPGGTLVYSTCSLEPDEDEAIVSWFLEAQPQARIQPILLPLEHSPAVQHWDGKQLHPGVLECLRLWPQDNDTEGFFVAKIKKQE